MGKVNHSVRLCSQGYGLPKVNTVDVPTSGGWGIQSVAWALLSFHISLLFHFDIKKIGGHVVGKLILLANFVMFSTGLAQSVRISGTVTNFAGSPIANAQVALGIGGLTASSDAQGRFTLTDGTGIGDPTISGLSGTIRNGFLNLRLEKKSRVTLSVFSTLGEKLSTQSRTLGSGEHAFPLYGKNGYFIYKLTADEKEFTFKHLAKPAATSAGFNDVLKVTAGGFIGHEGILFAPGTGIDTSGLKIVLLKEGDLPHFSFFVTSLVAMQALSGNPKGFGGDLRYGHTGAGAGLRGADKICADVAERALKGSAAKQWRAFLSVSDAGNGAKKDAIDRIGPGPWYDRTGRVLATNLTGLLSADRPAGGDVTIASDLPNETGVPNHTADGVTMDNHDVLTGSDKAGRIHTYPNCENWTTTTTPSGGTGGRGNGPMAGHSWPASSGQNWMQAHGVAGCAASVVTGQGSPSGSGVGDGGGYGGIYCFALVP